MEEDRVIATKSSEMKNSEKNSISILYVDDEKVNLRVFKLLMRRTFNVHVVDNPNEALSILDEKEIHIIISDQKMEAMNGTELLKKVDKIHPKVIKMLLTGDNSQSEVINAMKDEYIYACITKPFDQDILSDLFIDAFKQYQNS